MFRRNKLFKKHTEQEEKEYYRQVQEEKLTWKDRFAMAWSAFLVIVLPCLLVLATLSLLTLLIFGII